MSRKQYDTGIWTNIPNRYGGINAIHIRHQHITKQDIWTGFLRYLYSRETIVGGNRGVSTICQNLFDTVCNPSFIIHNNDPKTLSATWITRD
ncbi:MAG TPA: hypothetical protein VFA90_15095 [Terriglobales bacterium]|nr:hypothetical protein [Terriglobales bacterium]